jgi:hypothetical protein
MTFPLNPPPATGYFLSHRWQQEIPAVVHPGDDVVLGWSPDGSRLLSPVTARAQWGFGVLWMVLPACAAGTAEA